MADALLVLNAGSSSLKFSVFPDREPLEPLLRGQLEGLFTLPRFSVKGRNGEQIAEREWPSGTQLGHEGAVEFLFDWGRKEGLRDYRIAAVGHRVVHGGMKYTQPVKITPDVMAALEKFVPLAPLHQPYNLAAVKSVTRRAPQLGQVACFDTSFHRSLPAVAQAFALPRRLAKEGVCRYGFHGLSYEYIASVLPAIDARAASGRTVVAHLGNGASMCALHAGKSIASTMSFTGVDGLPMGTRCGSLDPGVMLYLMDQHGMDARALEKLIYKESGLLGVSGFSSDMRELLDSRAPEAAEAVDLFVYRIGRELGSLAAALGGLDALVFTGGIGENSPSIRDDVCRQAAWLGVEIDNAANDAGGRHISSPESRVAVLVVPTNEELMIAQHTKRILAAVGK
jgi:acetate kinase